MENISGKNRALSRGRFIAATLISAASMAFALIFFPNIKLPNFPKDAKSEISIMDIGARNSELSVYDMFDYSSVFFPMRWSRIGFSSDIPEYSLSDWADYEKIDISYAQLLRGESFDYVKSKPRNYSKNAFFKFILKETLMEAGRENLFLKERASVHSKKEEALPQKTSVHDEKSLPLIHFGVVDFRTGKTLLSGKFDDTVQYDKFSRQFLSTAEFHVSKTPNYGLSHALRMRGSGNETLDDLFEKNIPSIMRDLDFGEYKILFFP